jgi:hypothetical protein
MKWSERFGRKDDEIPKELEGKTPEEIAAALNESADTKTKLQAAETARQTAEDAMRTQNTQFDEMKKKLAALEANTVPPPLDSDLDEPPSPWIDPAKFVADQTKGIANTALMSGMMTARMYFQQGLTGDDVKIFGKYQSEVDKIVGTFAPEQRVMPQSWFNAFLYVKGAHMGDIMKAKQDSTDFFSETASRSVNQEPPPADKLTADEEEVCKKFHYDPVKYLANKKRGETMQGEKGTYSRFAVPVKQS